MFMLLFGRILSTTTGPSVLWIRVTVSSSIQTQFSGRLPTYSLRELEQSNNIIWKFMAFKFIEISPGQDDCYLIHLFTIQKKNKIRLILDCKHINAHIQCHHFKMEGVPALREIIEKDDCSLCPYFIPTS